MILSYPMMKYYKTIFFIIFIVFQFENRMSAQWRVNSGNNAFDGNYKSAILMGKGYKFPYQKPNLVFNLFNNKDSNFYLSDIGYVGCDNNILVFKFDKVDKYYYSYPQENANNDILFFDNFGYLDSENEFVNIDKLKIIELFKKNQKLSIRYSNDCTSMDFDFNLSGSTVSLDKVYLNYYSVLKKIQNERIKELEDSENQKIERERTIKFETQKRKTNDSLKKAEIILRNNKNFIIDKQLSIYNNEFQERLISTKPQFINGEIVTSDTILFKGRFVKELGFDNLNKLAFKEDEIIEVYNYFINDSLKIKRNDTTILIHRFESPFGPMHIAFDLYQEMKSKWSNYEKEFIQEKNKEYQNQKQIETERIETFYKTYRPQKNRTDFDLKITELYLDIDCVINIYQSPNDLKPVKLKLNKNSKLEILNDYKGFKMRIKYHDQIRYLDFFEISKLKDIEYLRPYLTFWYAYYK
jgi:hypothetical protein